MTYKENIKVILECYFTGFKEEIIDSACNRILGQEPCEEHQREFIELVVEYPNPDLCTYPEYRGKPYFSIKYQENGKNYIGFGTYKIEILSQWIKENFISVTPKPKTGHWRHYEGMLYCSKCGAEFYDEITEYTGDEVPKYCPDCGAKMESEDKE